jgi:divalent metal cation (Fe/Co/Zn/Cd) transporter
VPRTYPMDRVEEIKREAQAAVRSTLEDADLTLTATPAPLDNESVRERIMVIARNIGLPIHHVTVHDLDRRLAVSIDLEVDGEMPLAAAHDITHRLENAIDAEFGERLEVDIHIEPLEPELPHGGDAPRERVDMIQSALSRIATTLGTMHDVHNVRVRNTGTGQIVNFHCRARPTLKVIEVHGAVDEIERALRREFADVRRVIGHAEPDR